MPTELTKENIQGAIQQARDWFSHSNPVIRAMYGSSEFEAMEGIKTEVNAKRAAKFAETRFSIMIQRVEAANDFTLNPLDIVGIWGCTEQASDDQQIALARFVTARYTVSTEKAPIGRWRFEVPQHFMKEGTLLPEVAQDLPGLQFVLGRVKSVFDNYEQIKTYLYGPEGSEQYGVLMNKADQGDSLAAAKLEDLLEGYYKRSNPVLEGVMKVFGPEVARFGNALSEAIDKIQPQLPQQPTLI